MLIHDQAANHQLCWNGPVTIRIAKSVPTSVSNPLVALDILRNHWAEYDRGDDYQAALDACLKATQGKGALAQAREAFIVATRHLAPASDQQDISADYPTSQTDASTHLHSSRTPSDHLAKAQMQQRPIR